MENPSYLDLSYCTLVPNTESQGETRYIREFAAEPIDFFFLNKILRTRIRLKMESNETVFDEDVNVYLAKMMSKFAIKPEEYTKTTHFDLKTKVTEFEESKLPQIVKEREIFLTYKGNVECLLMRLGTFKQHNEREEEYLQRYLKITHIYSQKFRKRRFEKEPSSLEGVYSKLEAELRKYLTILQGTDLFTRFNDSRLKSLIKEGEQIFKKKNKED